METPVKKVTIGNPQELASALAKKKIQTVIYPGGDSSKHIFITFTDGTRVAFRPDVISYFSYFNSSLMKKIGEPFFTKQQMHERYLAERRERDRERREERKSKLQRYRDLKRELGL